MVDKINEVEIKFAICDMKEDYFKQEAKERESESANVEEIKEKENLLFNMRMRLKL